MRRQGLSAIAYPQASLAGEHVNLLYLSTVTLPVVIWRVVVE